MKCAIILVGFQRLDKGTIFTIWALANYCGLAYAICSNRVLPADDLFIKAGKYMQNLADNWPTIAVAATKKNYQLF